MTDEDPFKNWYQQQPAGDPADATRDMTMRIYTKVKSGSKRQALAKLSYIGTVTSPDHLLQLPAKSG